MTPATNNRNAQAFWEEEYHLYPHTQRVYGINQNPLTHQHLAAENSDAALELWLDRFGTPEERVQFEEWRQAQDAGNEAEAGA